MPANLNNSSAPAPQQPAFTPEGSLPTTNPGQRPDISSVSTESSLEQLVRENHDVIQDVQKRLKRIERLQLAKLIMTVLFVVAPVIGAALLLPSFYNTIASSYGLDTTGDNSGIMSIFNQVQDTQKSLNAINVANQ